MSNLIFPSFPGMDIAIKRTPVFATKIQTASSGKELRATFQSTPRYRYQIPLNFLRQAVFNATADEAAQLSYLLFKQRGRWDSFLFLDPYDNSDTGMGFGVGNGTTTAFQLQRQEPGVYTNILGTYLVSTTPRTNLSTNSQTVGGTGWSAGAGGTGTIPSPIANAGVAPDGTVTASRLQCTQGAGNTPSDYSFFSGPSITLANGVTYTVSIWLKSNTGSNQAAYLVDSDAGLGAITLTPSWQRFSFQVVGSGAAGSLWVGLRGTVTPGGSTLDALGWGAQVEVGSSATDYIPTIGAAVTATPSYYPGSDGFEPVTEPMPGITIYKNGVALAQGADWNLGAAGMITFTVAPTSGAILTWSGGYYRRVRFDSDEQDFERFLDRVWEAKALPLISVK